MRYPQTFIDDLRRQADLVRVLHDSLPLKKKGANWMACCPFHKEKTSYFSVSPAEEIFYCFGYNKGRQVTGALRRAVGDLLKQHPHVARFQPATPDHGGTGATVVDLRS